MTETLVIKDFCGIREAKIDLSPINLFIGPQATGKSVAAKLVYFFREAISGLRGFAVSQREWKGVLRDLNRRLVTYFGPHGIGTKGFSLNYTKGGHTLRIFRAADDAAKIEIEADKFFADLYGELISVARSANPSVDGSAESAPQVDIAQALRDRFLALCGPDLGISATYEQFFLPAARASFALLPTQMLGQIATGENIDVWMPKFASLLSTTRNILRTYGFYHGAVPSKKLSSEQRKILSESRQYAERILHAQMEYEGESERLRLDDDRTIPLIRASSGQQEALPLLLILSRFATLFHFEGRSVFIEEPEAHLWPGAQRDIIYLLASTFIRRKDQMQLVLTTHSPYVLTIFNNLLEAGRKYSGLLANPPTKREQSKIAARRKRLGAIVPQSCALPPESVTAWQFSDGKVTSLNTNKYGILGADLLDDVSEELDSVWNSLQEIPE